MDGGVTPRTESGDDWLILADDLTGACDCAVAFASVGRRASVICDEAIPVSGTVALDIDSRRLGPVAAAGAVRAALRGAGQRRRHLFKKIDSTLRGQPVAEIVAAIQHRQAAGQGAMVLLAPAFPATGRTLEEGKVRLRGRPLEESPLWIRDHSYPTADLAVVLRAEGLRVLPLSLTAVRDAPEALQARMRDALLAGIEVVLCDAVTAADLGRIAMAGLPLGDAIVWAGSGGLALALAELLPAACRATVQVIRPPGGTLFVVGSIAEASRAAAAALAADAGVRAIALPAHLLRQPAPSSIGVEIAETLRAGSDVLVTIAQEDAADLSEGKAIATGLARLLAPSAPALGALFATGGETARCLLRAFGVSGIRLMGEIEPGLPWGIMEGALQCPIATKAGGFGDADTLRRCLDHLRDL